MNKELWTNKNIDLLKSYIKSRQILYFLTFVLLNGVDRTSLELGRIGVQNRIKKKLSRKYRKTIEKEEVVPLEEQGKYANKVWFCWFQGLENSPDIVKLCYRSIVDNSARDVVVITDYNYKEYTNLPEHIVYKYEKGIISKTHFSDILRTDLLARHGGIWIDSTVLLTDRLPDTSEDIALDLFFFQKCKPSRDGNDVFLSSWFIYAKPNNKIILKTRTLLFNYWEKNNFLIDYFLFHIFFCIACNRFSEEYESVPKVDNSAPHYIQLEFQKKFSKERYKQILKKSGVHKLTYKISNSIINDTENLYNYIIKDKE